MAPSEIKAPDSEAGERMKALTVDAASAGSRLDQWLAAQLAPDLSRNRIKALIEAGTVAVDGAAVT